MNEVFRLEFLADGAWVKDGSATGSLVTAKDVAEKQFDTSTMNCVRILDETGKLEYSSGRRDRVDAPMTWLDS